MECEKLVNEVLSELYKRLENWTDKLTGKKKLVVIGNFNPSEYVSLENEYEILKYEKGMKPQSGDTVIITEMPLGMLASIATGSAIEDSHEYIIKMLLLGSKVSMLESGFQYRSYQKTAFKSIFQLYSEYEKKLVQFGLNIIGTPLQLQNKNEALSSQKDTLISDFSEIDLTLKKLLLETDLRKCHIKERSIVKLNGGCIITPLASDYIRNNNLSIKRI